MSHPIGLIRKFFICFSVTSMKKLEEAGFTLASRPIGALNKDFY